MGGAFARAVWRSSAARHLVRASTVWHLSMIVTTRMRATSFSPLVTRGGSSGVVASSMSGKRTVQEYSIGQCGMDLRKPVPGCRVHQGLSARPGGVVRQASPTKPGQLLKQMAESEERAALGTRSLRHAVRSLCQSDADGRTLRLLLSYNGKPILVKDMSCEGNYTAVSWAPRSWARSRKIELRQNALA